MMKKRYLFLIIIVCLFSISTASAEEIVNATNELSISDNYVSISNEEITVEQTNVLTTNLSNDLYSTGNNEWYVNASADDGGTGTKTNPYNNFKVVLDNPNLQNGDTIYFAGGKSYTGENNTNLEFEKNLNLVKWGNDEVIFDGNYTYRIFVSYSQEMNIIGLTFINGNAERGGAINFARLIKGNINCTFINNNAYYHGGAIFASTMANVNITSTFINNKAYGDGGAIFISTTTSDVNLNSIFINNSADHGGALYLGGVNYMDIGSTFRNNSANYGGAIFVKASVIGHLNVKSTFVDNIASWGGAINFGDSVSSSYFNSSFINNKAFYAAGAICVMGFVSNLNIFSTFINNSASTYGGAIIFSTKVSSLNLFSTFINNSVINGYGGVIASFEEMSNSIIQSTFINNTSPSSLIYCYESINTKICNSIFLNNKYDLTIIDVKLGKMGANENWFGNNATNFNKKPNVGDNVNCDSWLFLNATADYLTNGQSNVVFNLNNLYDSSSEQISHPDISKLPKCYLNLNAKNGNLNKYSILPGENVIFTSAASEDMFVSAKCENAYYSVEITEWSVNILAPNVTKYYGGYERFVVTLTDSMSNPISNANVKITINGNPYTRTTDSNGVASMAINLNSGEYDVTTEYEETKVYSTITVKDTVYANDFTKMYKNATQYYGTFVNTNGKTLAENTPIEININGVFYTRYTNDKGVARMNINLNPGTYVLTAKNPATGEKHTTTIIVLGTIVENYDLTKYYKNDSQYSLRLLDDKGNPVKAGIDIRLNINGVFYTRTSNDNGYVKMNINLNPGEYIITAEYNGLMASNTIKVLSVIETHDLSMKYKDGSKFEAKILDGQGKPYAGQTVTFNINGVFYERITDEMGIARLTINLMPGEYIITSSYNGLNAANNVKVEDNLYEYTTESGDKVLVKNNVIVASYDAGSWNYNGQFTGMTIDEFKNWDNILSKYGMSDYSAYLLDGKPEIPNVDVEHFRYDGNSYWYDYSY